MTIPSALRALYSAVLEAVFPTPAAELEALSMNGEQALSLLPRASQFPIAEACSIFSYKDERAWRLIWALKYKKSRRAAEITGYALNSILDVYARAAGRIIIVPMPITQRRRRERGYNQCELLADAIEKIGSANNIFIIRDLLFRVRHKSRQTLKDRSHRLASAEDLFAVNEDAAQRIKNEGIPVRNDELIIVIDDVVTTGGTIRDAVHTLRRAGFQNAFGLSVAH